MPLKTKYLKAHIGEEESPASTVTEPITITVVPTGRKGFYYRISEHQNDLSVSIINELQLTAIRQMLRGEDENAD